MSNTLDQQRSRAGCRRADGRSPSASAPSCSLRSCSWSTWIAIAPASAARTPRRRCSSRSSSSRRARPARSSRASRMYAPTTLPQKEVEVGAISDPAYLSGRAAATDIFPGQQFTATDFAASDTASVDSQITGTQRAFSISIDGVHGVSSAGACPATRVDVYIVRRRRGEALPAERQGAHDSDDSRPGRRRQPRPADRDEGSRDLAVRGRQHAVDLRAASGRRCEADEAVAGQCVYGAEVDERII